MPLPEPSVLFQHVTYGNALAALGLYVLGFVVVDNVRKPRLPSSLPTVGSNGGLFSGVKTFFLGMKYIPTWLQEGYVQYNKKGRSFVLPSDFGTNAEIVVPREQLQWLVEQPDNVLSTSAAHFDTLHGEYSFITPQLLHDPYHEHVVHRSLARSLNALIPEIEDEVRRSMDEALGTDTDNWKEINVWNTLLTIVPKLTNRMLVGQPLNRNPEYLRNMIAYTDDVVRNMILLNMVPRALHPLVGSALGAVNKYHFRQTARFSVPLIQERLRAFERRDAGDPEFEDWQEPNDYITWHIRLARAEGRTDELDATRIAQRLMPINFAAIHTTVLTAHGTLLDLVSSDPSHGFLDGLREEARRVYDEEGGRWSKNGLGRLYRVDSALREGMRVSTFAQTLVGRKVVAPGGVTNAAEGWHVPLGGLLSLPLSAIFHDPDMFDDPLQYDAFRHSRPREEFEARPVEKRDQEEGLKLKQRSLVTTGEAHFAFGHGRHACPGRFFVAHELKMVIAYLVLNYDIKPLPARPTSKWIGRNMVPAMEACIEVRRRPDSVY
ncbi:cytochrome P450 [Auricularia subglabra TFB-10046 SS5]|nr:cytochrome P450 [Auricularia subglabra TFB-10046 SS5]